MSLIGYVVGSTWTIPPHTRFYGYNITSRAMPSYLPLLKERASTYVDFNAKIGTGILSQWQCYVDTGSVSNPQSQTVNFQIWEVLSTSFGGGVPTNYTVRLRFSQSEVIGTANGVYTVSCWYRLCS